MVIRLERSDKLLTRDFFNAECWRKKLKAWIIVISLYDAVVHREILIVTRKSLSFC